MPSKADSPISLQSASAGRFGDKVRLRRKGPDISLLRDTFSRKVDIPQEITHLHHG